jgi:hypothetical protein
MRRVLSKRRRRRRRAEIEGESVVVWFPEWVGVAVYF